MRTIPVLVLLYSITLAAEAQQRRYQTKFSLDIARTQAVQDALRYVDRNFQSQIEEWIRITQIPAPSRMETQRAEYVRSQLEAVDIETTIDSIGNVVGVRRGTGGGPTVVFAAHMDTVHPIDTDVTVTRREGRLLAPGVFDNSASVTNMLAAARAMRAAQIRTTGDVIFIGTVQEELGLRGMSYWLDHNPGVADMLIALDGGLGPVAYGALGIRWSRMRFSGAGSHTNTSRGKPHPARAAARCILDIYTIPLPPPGSPSRTVYNVGMINGGKVVNAIAEEVSFTVDVRSTDPDILASLDSAIVDKCHASASADGVQFRREYLLETPAGGTAEHLADRRAHPLVQTAVDALLYLGYDFGGRPEAVAFGSTDANAGVVRGIPSVSVGRSRGGDQHTLREWAEIESARIGTKQIILLAAALAELETR